jgi:cell division protein ZapA
MKERGQVTEVRIFHHTYSIRSENGPEYVESLAEYVDRKMREISEATPAVDTSRIAILAALHIADDFFNARTEMSELRKDVLDRGQRMISLLEEAADEGASP